MKEIMFDELNVGARKSNTPTTDWLLHNHQAGVEREMRQFSQSEAGQICKSKERLCIGDELVLCGQPTPIGLHAGGTPHAVEVLPAGVSLSDAAKMLQEGGLRSFQSLPLSLSAAELNEMAADIAQLASKR